MNDDPRYTAETEVPEPELELVRFEVTAREAIKITQAHAASLEAQSRDAETLAEVAVKYLEKDAPMKLHDFDFTTGELVFLRQKKDKPAPTE